MLNALGGDEFVGDLADGSGAPTHRQDFEAVVVVKVDVQGGDNDIMMVVLDVGQGGLHMLLVVIVHQGDGAGNLLIGIFLPMLDQLRPDHVRNG